MSTTRDPSPRRASAPPRTAAARLADIKPEAISVQLAARLLGVHEETIRRWIKAGRIVAVRVGPRLLRIPRSELSRLRSRPHISA